MKHFLIVFFTLTLRLDAKSSLKDLRKKITTLDLTKIEVVDLCTNRKSHLTNLQFVKVWSINCTNCLWEFEDHRSKLDQRYMLINIDTGPIERKNACRWIKEHGIKAFSVNDNGSIKNLLGEDYPLPMSFTVKDQSLSDIKFGYWRNK